MIINRYGKRIRIIIEDLNYIHQYKGTPFMNNRLNTFHIAIDLTACIK